MPGSVAKERMFWGRFRGVNGSMERSGWLGSGWAEAVELKGKKNAGIFGGLIR
jgi:hypothetical protein